MHVVDPSFGWQEGIVCYVSLLIAAFLVSWLVTDVLKVRRTAYVAILAAVVCALSGVYVAWSGASAVRLLTSAWGWGLLAGALAVATVTPLLRRLPAHPHARGRRLTVAFLWEGVVYGTTEALLLAALPALIIWQATTDAGWTDGRWGAFGSGALATIGALVVILVHHLGYAEFRSVAARRMMAGALFACGLQAIAFLLTGNVLAPVVAHIVLHAELILRGDEMPPAGTRPTDAGTTKLRPNRPSVRAAA